jgi:hypothetical protein
LVPPQIAVRRSALPEPVQALQPVMAIRMERHVAMN